MIINKDAQELRYLMVTFAISFPLDIALVAINKCTILLYILIFCQLLMIIILSSIFYFKFKVSKLGLKKSMEIFFIVSRLKQGLIKAHIYFELYRNNGVLYVRLPKIKVIPSDFGFMISIENSIKYQEKFTNLDISASLGKYIVDTSYMTDDQSAFIYELDDPRQDRRFIFSSLQELKDVQIDKYRIPVDKKLSFELCHNLCVGATGHGKSYWLYYYVIALLNRFGKDSIYVCDPKNSSMAIIGEKIGHVAITKEESLELLREFHQHMQERKQELSDLLKSGLDKDYRDFNLQPRVLIFDEYATFRSSLKSLATKKEGKTLVAEIDEIIDEVILQGRQLGCFCSIAMQKSDSNLLPTHIRNSLLFKQVLGQAENTTYITAFEHAQIPARKVGVGEGFYTLQGKTIEPRYFTTPRLDFDIYDAIIELTSET
ncbi:hypothetical protein [Streptococcus anginosus]|uniref:hypothetical protein n=1 Tax=Streptococcus anginosus TaxID=1328 RepID=UPI0022DFB1F1|nr:hypothetical protein [Streptococcus anginosus]